MGSEVEDDPWADLLGSWEEGDITDEDAFGKGLDADEVMGDLAELLDQVPDTWGGGSEKDLLVYLWSVLKTNGLVTVETYREHVKAVAALLALYRLKTSFYRYAFTEGDVGDGESVAYDLIGPYPKAEPFWLGVVAGRGGLDEPCGWEPERSWEEEALAELASQQYPVITDALVETLGESGLFATLWTSAKGDAVFPVPGDIVWEILNEDPWEKGPAWEWLTNGMTP